MSQNSREDITRPRCINHGCDRPAHWSKNRFRTVCSHCHAAGYGLKPYRPGVRPFRTGRCSNSDGHLGFACPIDYAKSPMFKGITELDHIDGNRNNHMQVNIQELCPMCHRVKSQMQGDFRATADMVRNKAVKRDIIVSVFD